MNKETVTLDRKYIHAKDDGVSHKEHSHLVIAQLTKMNIKNLGLILDFDSANLKPASEKRLREILRNHLVIQHKNTMLKEKNNG